MAIQLPIKKILDQVDRAALLEWLSAREQRAEQSMHKFSEKNQRAKEEYYGGKMDAFIDVIQYLTEKRD